MKLTLGIVGELGTGKVEGVDNGEGHGSGESTRGDVGGEFGGGRGGGGGGEKSLDLSLEGEVQRLGGEVSEDVGQVAAPEGSDSLAGQGAFGAVNNAAVRTIEHALLDHLILVLDQEFYPLNWGGGGLKTSLRNRPSQSEMRTGRIPCTFRPKLYFTLDTPAATPESMKSSKNPSFAFPMIKLFDLKYSHLQSEFIKAL